MIPTKNTTFHTTGWQLGKPVLAVILMLYLLHALTGCTVYTYLLEYANTNADSTTLNNVSAYQQVLPYQGKVISPFGNRNGHNHTGTDIKLKHGDTVYAACCGYVTKATTYGGYGKLVILKHADNMETYYAHLSRILVQFGDSILAGDPVGLGGRTGTATTDHLHFEVRKKNKPLNPEQFYNFAEGATKNFILHQPDLPTNMAEHTSIKTSPLAAMQLSTDFQPKVDQSKNQTIIKIKKGDTLYSLSRQYGTTVHQLQIWNNLNGSLLKIGMPLRVH